MDFTLLYWHWIVIGFALALAELFLGSFFIIWFGMAALVVGAALLLFPDMTTTLQLFLWTILSCAFAVSWFKFFKPLTLDKTKAGLSRERIVGEVGQVLSAPTAERRGTLRFPAPILGADEWQFLTQDTVVAGDRVRVTDLSGNTLVVQKT